MGSFLVGYGVLLLSLASLCAGALATDTLPWEGYWLAWSLLGLAWVDGLACVYWGGRRG